MHRVRSTAHAITVFSTPTPRYPAHGVDQADVNTSSFTSLSASHGNGEAKRGMEHTAGCTMDS